MSHVLALTILYFSANETLHFLSDIAEMKILSIFINISEYIVDFVDINKYILMTSTLA